MKVNLTSKFRKDVKKLQKRGKDFQKLKDAVTILLLGEPLPPKSQDHLLTGNWAGWRECHLESDWLLIYQLSPDELLLGRTGTHSDLF